VLIRKYIGLTQGGLARQVGCAEITVRKFEVDACWLSNCKWPAPRRWHSLSQQLQR